MVGLILCLLVSDVDFVSKQVMERGRKYDFQGVGGGGVAWALTVFDAHRFYEVTVHEGKDGSRWMSIDYYVTSIDFSQIKSAADLAVYEFRMGRPRIFREYHMTDDDIDGEVDSVQEFSAGPAGFTREERDLGVTKSGLKVGQRIEKGKRGQKFFGEVLGQIRRAM